MSKYEKWNEKQKGENYIFVAETKYEKEFISFPFFSTFKNTNKILFQLTC